MGPTGDKKPELLPGKFSGQVENTEGEIVEDVLAGPHQGVETSSSS